MPVATLDISDDEVNRKMKTMTKTTTIGKNDGYGNDEEGYSRSDEDKIRDDREDNNNHNKGESPPKHFRDDEEGLEDEDLGGTREEEEC